MKSYHFQPRNPLHKVPGDNPALDKYDPDQEKHREVLPIPPRDERVSYLFPHEWDELKIREGETYDWEPWDGECQGDCCREGH